MLNLLAYVYFIDLLSFEHNVYKKYQYLYCAKNLIRNIVMSKLQARKRNNIFPLMISNEHRCLITLFWIYVLDKQMDMERADGMLLVWKAEKPVFGRNNYFWYYFGCVEFLFSDLGMTHCCWVNIRCRKC